MSRIVPRNSTKLVGLLVIIYWVKDLTNIPDETLRFASISLLIFSVPFYIHAFSGIETLLFSYLSFRFFITSNEDYEKQIFLTAILTMCRPEGVLFGIVPAWNYIKRRQFFDKTYLNLNNILLLTTASFFLILYIIKFAYFEQILPNTFVVKSGSGTSLYAKFFTIYELVPWLVVNCFGANSSILRQKILYQSQL